jgi:hypothetical protein
MSISLPRKGFHFGELFPGVILSLCSPSGEGELRDRIPPKDRIFLAFLPREDGLLDAVLDGCVHQVRFQGNDPSGCGSIWMSFF